jgi:pimeloyl-ACP methyl ester carboxylesterase
MIVDKNCILYTEEKKPIVYDLYYIPSGDKKPVVIFCHGYKGFKDWGAWHLVAEAFANAGYLFLKFNFSHNGGTAEDPIDFPDLDAFAENNFSLELDDLDRIINFLDSNKSLHSEIIKNNINLLGHSRGGGIALKKAEESSSIKTVTTWAGVCDFKARFQEGTEAFNVWKTTGITHVENGRTKQQMPHYFQFYTNFMANEKRLTIKRAVQNLKIPQLIVQGSEDPTVSINEAEALHHWNKNSQLEVIKKADHVFGTQHPWRKKRLAKDLEITVNLTIKFLNNQLIIND